MKCVKCGNELQPGARFCVFCGNPVEETPVTETAPVVEETPVVQAEPAVEATPVVEPTPVVDPVPAVELTPVADSVPAVEPTPAVAPTPSYEQPVYTQPVYEQPVQQNMGYESPYATAMNPTPENVQKKSGKVLVGVIIAVVALVAILIAAVLAIFVGRGKGSSDVSKHLSYAKNGKLYYLKDIRKDDEAIVVSAIKNASDSDNYMLSGRFTEDGKYLYFFNKMENSYTGKLCRVEVSKLKDDEDKNEEVIEELVSGVTSYDLLDDDRFVYQNDSYDLYYYDGEDKNKVVSSVSYFTMEGTERINFTTNDNQVGYYDIAEDKTEIVISDCSYIVADTENGHFYTKYNDDTYRYSLYYSNNEGDSEKIAEETYSILGANNKLSTVYYVMERVENVCYYDLVNDIYEAADANLTEPVYSDFITPCTEYDAMNDWDREYYATYPEYISDFYSWLYTDYTFNSGLLYYYSYHVDANGDYIYGYYFYDESINQWYAFDDAAYYDAYNAYYGVSDRVNLRENLKNSTTDIYYYDLMAWTPEQGSETLATNISPYSVSLLGQTGMVTYQKYADYDKIDWPEDAYGTWFVDDYIYNVRYGEDADTKYYYSCNGTENEWNSDWGELGGSVYFDASPSGQYVMGFIYNYDDDYNYVSKMNAYKVEEGALTLLDSDIANTSYGLWINDDYYYFEADSDNEGDLCCYSNGKSTTVLKNISNTQVKRFEDGTCSAFSDYNYYDGGTLKLYNADGDSVKIDSNVNSYCYINDELIVYLRDGKLYIYRGEDKEKFKVDSSVTAFTCDQAPYESLLY